MKRENEIESTVNDLDTYSIIPQLLSWHLFTCFLSKDINPLVEYLRNQFLGLFFRFCHFFFFILNFPPLATFFISIIHSFFGFFFLISFILCSFSLCFYLSSFCFYHHCFPYFRFHYFLQSSGHLIIFTSPILQSILESWQASHSVTNFIQLVSPQPVGRFS